MKFALVQRHGRGDDIQLLEIQHDGGQELVLMSTKDKVTDGSEELDFGFDTETGVIARFAPSSIGLQMGLAVLSAIE